MTEKESFWAAKSLITQQARTFHFSLPLLYQVKGQLTNWEKTEGTREREEGKILQVSPSPGMLPVTIISPSEKKALLQVKFKFLGFSGNYMTGQEEVKS